MAYTVHGRQRLIGADASASKHYVADTAAELISSMTPAPRAGDTGYALDDAAGLYVYSGSAWAEVTGAASGGDAWRSFLYGPGTDGDLTLVANTTLASGEFIKFYDDVDVANFTLSFNSADKWGIIHVKGTLTFNGGKISMDGQSVAGGSGAAGSGGAGSGGNGEKGGGALWVFAKTIVGTGTISSNGVAGTNGTNGTAPTSAGSGNPGSIGQKKFVWGEQSGGVVAAQGGGGGGASPGSGGQGETQATAQTQFLKDVSGHMSMSSPATGSVAIYRKHNGGAGAGGGAGGRNNTGIDQASGGTGGGGGSLYGAGGAGGAGGNSGTGSASGGGAGGGAGAGGTVFVVSDQVPDTLTVTANGGKGGDGGTADSATGGTGGGGGGGGGGVAGLVAQAGNTATLQANGGAKGLAGGGPGVAGSDGVAGGAGLAYNITSA